MSEHGFRSVFAADLDAYLQFKEAIGCQNRSRVWYLRTFDAYCVAHDRTVFDRETVEGWVIEHLERWGGRRSWMSYVRDLAGGFASVAAPTPTFSRIGGRQRRRSRTRTC